MNEQTPAQIIWQQITIPTKMTVGAHQPIVFKNTLTFKVKVKCNQAHWIEVQYNPETDNYNITLIHIRKWKRTEPKSCKNIGVENLNQTIREYCTN